MSLTSRNPATLEELAVIQEYTPDQVQTAISEAQAEFGPWSATPLKDRTLMIRSLGDEIRRDKDHLATLITEEMGCPITQAHAEIEKCAYICDYFADHAKEFLNSKILTSGSRQTQINFEPLGVMLHVAPWNYPFYLALRPVIPAVLAGNTVLLKHSSNVPRTGEALQALFERAGFANGVFRNLPIASSQVEAIIADMRVRLVSLIGSETAGRAVGSLAGKYLKKSILELGGSDPFIVFPDADLEKAVKAAAGSRLRNAGQSCNAAKRFLVASSVREQFVELLEAEFSKWQPGDPSLPQTEMGPLATENSLKDAIRQVGQSLEMGAKIICGGTRPDIGLPGYFYAPTILTQIRPEMPVFKEETFAPIAPVIAFETVEEAVWLANNSEFGLGASIWTADEELGQKLIPLIEVGNVYVNEVVRGDPKLPYGGVKNSGYGREFGEIGIQELTNIKSVVLNRS